MGLASWTVTSTAARQRSSQPPVWMLAILGWAVDPVIFRVIDSLTFVGYALRREGVSLGLVWFFK
jgi:hypothetical protein